jgi:hypothetical protein
MPTLTDEQIKACIAAGGVGAIALDTSVFDQFGCNLGYKTLRKLDQFNGTDIAVVFSEIVAGEVKAHIAKAAEESATALKIALGKYRKGWALDFDRAAREADLGLNEDPAAFAERQFATFMQTVGATIAPVEGAVSLADVVRRYFNATSPFSRKEGKKNEFPDALALLSLETWAEANNTLVMVLSRDSDWMNYAAGSARLFCLENINEGLDYFNQEARFVATRVLAKLREGRAPELNESIDNAIQAVLDDLDFQVHGASAYNYEYTPASAVLQWWQLPERAEPLVVASDDESVTFSIDVVGLVAFEAEFSFFVSIDRDDVHFGSSMQNVEERASFPVVITVTREIDPEPEVLDIDVTRTRIDVDFGSIEPDGAYEE